MNADTLCTLLAQRIPPEQFQLHGLDVVFFDPDKNNKPVDSPHESPYDTPENRAIVADVIKNYDTLAADLKPDEPTKTDLTELKAATTIAGLKAALVKILEGK